jgi:hypothetical protein
MAKIVCVHGIGQQLRGPELLGLEWRAALRDGMRNAGAPERDIPDDANISMVFYGELFRGRTKGTAGPPLVLADIEPGLESDLIMYWEAVARLETNQSNDADSRKSGWVPRPVQTLAERLLKHKRFADMTECAFVGDLKQVRWYLTEAETRRKVRARLVSLLSDETRVVIGHSLGSIIAYEGLCEIGLPIDTLITIGSPIGLPNLIFERLDPAPIDGQGVWPRMLRAWINIADVHDVVASVKTLGPLFGGRIQDTTVNNEGLAHDASPYLTDAKTGREIWDALQGR